MARIIGRLLFSLTVLAITGFVLLALIGLWDRYAKETTALGFRGIYERLAGQSGSNDWKTRTSADRERAQQPDRERVAARLVLKLVGTGAIGPANQGTSVAVSADGKTAIVGGPGPNNADRDRSPLVGHVGAAWVFTRSGTIWTQQGNKLIGTMSEYGGGLWSQGTSVALSADGDTRTTGAAWVFSRKDGVWAQQGNKLVGTGASGAGDPSSSLGQGMSVALSADGDTAIVGAWRAEAAWVFTRSSAVWKQQGNKLVGSGAIGHASQGISVALSADGNTALVGGWSDNNKTGAAWVFIRKGSVWTQQGKKLVGSGAVGNARQGSSVALSADGNTAIVGGPGDNSSDRSAPFGAGAFGAAWVFTRSDGVWTQQGNKLVSNGGVWTQQGTSVALSADGNTALVAGFAQNRSVSAASVFTRSDGQWMQGKTLAGKSTLGKSAPSIALSADGGIVLLGDPSENGGMGAAWVLSRADSGGY